MTSWYHLFIFLHASLVLLFATTSLISSPAFPTLYILSSFKYACNHRVSVLCSCWFVVSFLHSAVLFSSRFQVASEIHGAVVLLFRGGFLNIYYRSLKCTSPSCTVPPYSDIMGQAARSLKYLLCILAPSPMSSPSTIRWSVGILGYLIPMMYKYSCLVPSM